MANSEQKTKYLCIEFHDVDGNINPTLSRCPASTEQVLAALQFLTEGADFCVSVQNEVKNFREIAKEFNNN